MPTIITNKYEVIRMLKNSEPLKNYILMGFSFEDEPFNYDVDFSDAKIDNVSFKGVLFGTKESPKYANFNNTTFIMRIPVTFTT
jgi:hypothetical protein